MDFGGGGGRSSASRFFETEATVADEEDEEEEVAKDDFFVDIGAELPDEDDGRRMRHQPLLPQEDEQDVEALERSIQARYARSSHTESDEETTDVDQQALLPSVRDPKLWMVKCMIGHEREAVACLMQKCIDKESELQIRSASALDHLKNYIYVEAEKEAHVKKACKGLRNIFSQRVILVPIREMTDVLSVETKAADLTRNTWVRMKIGKYKGDLSQVVDVDNVRQRVTVKLIPRIDLQALANRLDGREVVKKRAFIPPPRFMNVNEARKLHIHVERRRDAMTGDYFEYIGGMLFRDGFLYKTVSIKVISSQNIKPSFNELENFRKPGDGDDLSALFLTGKKGPFMKGDAVMVVKGDLKNLKGWVERVVEENVHIRPEMKGLPKTLAVNEKELCKYFEPGNHVKVVSGAHEGATGMVVKVDRHVLIILCDTTKEHIHVFAGAVVESSAITSGVSKIGDELCDQGGGRGHDGLNGTTAKICQGPYKGCRGRVVEVKGQHVQVELESQMKVVSVDRNVVVSTSYRDTRSETQMHPPLTSLHPYTPMRDGGATPVHDAMRTPRRNGAWDPHCSN